MSSPDLAVAALVLIAVAAACAAVLGARDLIIDLASAIREVREVRRCLRIVEAQRRASQDTTNAISSYRSNLEGFLREE